MSLEIATYIDELQANWPVNTDVVSQGDDHIRLIKQVLQNTFPYVSGPVTASDVVLSRGAIPINAITVFYMATAPSGWARVDPASSCGLRVVPTGSEGGVSGGSDNPVVNAKVPAHYHAINLNSATESDNHAHWVSGASGLESSHSHYLSIASNSVDNHNHYVDLATSSVALNSNNGNIPSGGAGGNAALTGANISHNHQVSGYTQGGGGHGHISAGNTAAGSAHQHTIELTSGVQSANHYHRTTGNSATATVTQAGGALGAWYPRYLDVILCQRTS